MMGFMGMGIGVAYCVHKIRNREGERKWRLLVLVLGILLNIVM